MPVAGSAIMLPLCKPAAAAAAAAAIAPLPFCCCCCSSSSSGLSAASGGALEKFPEAVGLSSIGFRKAPAAAAVLNVRARVSVKCRIRSSTEGNRSLVVAVCGSSGEGDHLVEVRADDQGTRRRRINSSKSVGMEDGGGGGGGGGNRIFGDGDYGSHGDREETKRNAQVQQHGLRAFSKEGYELTPPSIVEDLNSESADPAESPVLNRLKKGFVRFKEEKFLKESELFSRLADGQQPKVMVIGCCDSRVDPTMLMELEPGEVFTLRNVANLVPPWEKEGTYHGTSAALEFAVMGLQVEHIIVLGHRHCGGIRALMTRSDFSSDFIGSWMKIGISARECTLKLMAGKALTDQCRFCEQESINVSLANLLTFSWIEDRVKQGKLGLHGWYYDFVDGSMISWEVKRQQYTSATHSSPATMSTRSYN